MALLIAILVVAALLAGFLYLTSLEKKRGRRFFERTRAAFDAKVARMGAYLSSGETHASLAHKLRDTADHAVHEIVHGGLLGIRAVERALTRLAREIRGRRAKSLQEKNGGENPTDSVQ
jgi:hypothetical protein